MPNPDDTPEPPPATRPRSQPSLLGEADAASRAGPSIDAGKMRMLDELEAVVRPRAEARASPLSGGAVALLGAAVVAVGAAWWWTTHLGSAAPAASAKALAVSVPAAASAPQIALNVERTAANAASAPARIETTAPTAATAAAEPDARQTPPAALPAARPVQRAPAVAKATPKKGDEKVTTVATRSGKRTMTVTQAGAAPAVKTPGTATAKTATDKSLASPADPVTRAGGARNPKAADDADVLLLSALLAHVSRNTAGGLLEEDQLTIAQLVKRCDARGADEARECRRRICEGYWGKAEACPAPATPKKG